MPQDFPVLTKSLLMQHFDEIVTAPGVTKAAIAEFLTRSKDPNDLFLGKYRVIHTSGSSGEVGYFVYSTTIGRLDDAPAARCTARSQTQRQIPRRVFRGHRRPLRRRHDGELDARGIAKLFIDIGLFEVNSPLPDVIAGLNAFQPDVLAGYTTAIKILAEKQRAGALKLDSLMAIMTAGEATTDADRAFLEQTFGCALYNTYACSEHLAMGGSLPGSSNIVLHDHDLIYELFPDHSIVTNMFNHTLPLIRYRMADILRPVDSDEHTPYLVIESLVGRNELQPVFKNRDGVDDFISPHTINEVFVAGVTRFQMHLVADDTFRFMVCLDASLDPADRAAAVEGVGHRLREILARKRMDNVRFEVVPTDDLPVNPRTRKFQLIVDKRAA